MSYPSRNLQLRDIVAIVSRNRRVIMLWPLFCLVAGAAFFYFCPRSYRSEARLFLRIGRESVGLDPAATAGQTMPLYTSNREDEVKSAQALIRSRSVATQVVDKLGANVVLGRGESKAATKSSVASLIRKPLDLVIGMVKDLDPISEHEEAVIKLEKGMTVSSEKQATVITVQYRASSPQLAQAVCDAIVEVAQQEHMRVHRSEESTPFFTEQQERLRQQLDASLEALRVAKNEMGLGSVEDRRKTLEQQFSAVELDRLTTQQQLATAEARIEDLQRQLEKTPERLVTSQKNVPNQGADMLRDRLYELQVKAMDLKARYSDSHPLVMAAEEQLTEAKKVLAEQASERAETTDEINPVHRDLLLSLKHEQSQQAGLMARLVQLDAQKEAVLAEVRAVNEQEIKIDRLTRDTELARSKYMQYAKTMEEARIDKELQGNGISNISVAQEATFAEKPVTPGRMFTAAGVFLFSVAGVVGIVLFREQALTPDSADADTISAVRHSSRRKARRELESKTNGHAKGAALSAPK
jgi:uncharacterized protein involved in exopolysaccharide biosynthesis